MTQSTNGKSPKKSPAKKPPPNTISCNWSDERKEAFARLAHNLGTTQGRLSSETLDEKWGDDLDRILAHMLKEHQEFEARNHEQS